MSQQNGPLSAKFPLPNAPNARSRRRKRRPHTEKRSRGHKWRASNKDKPPSGFTSGSGVLISLRRWSPSSSRVTVSGGDAFPA